MKLSIVITTRDRKNDLLRCVESVLKSHLGGLKFEIIIVDDASTDGTENLTPSDFDFPPVSVIHNKENLMMAKTRNVGARAAKGKYILFVDDDNILDKDMIGYLVDAADRYHNFGILGPAMYLHKPRKRYLDFQKFNFFTGKTSAHLESSGKEICESDGIPNVFLVKKEVFDKAGYFDADLLQTYTEPELYFRAKNAGYKCGIVQKAKTYHDVTLESSFAPRNLGGKFPQKAYCLIRNRNIVVWRYGNILQKIVFTLFFSWAWPTIYSLIILKYGRLDLIKLYWLGYRDSLHYLFTGKVRCVVF